MIGSLTSLQDDRCNGAYNMVWSVDKIEKRSYDKRKKVLLIWCSLLEHQDTSFHQLLNVTVGLEQRMKSLEDLRQHRLD